MIHIKKILKKKDSNFLILFICTSSARGWGGGGSMVRLHPLLMSQIPVFLSLTYYLPIGLKLGGITTDRLALGWGWGFLAESIGQCKYPAAPVEPGSGYSQGSQAFSRDHSLITAQKARNITGAGSRDI